RRMEAAASAAATPPVEPPTIRICVRSSRGMAEMITAEADKMQSVSALSEEQIVDAIRAMGVRPGDLLLSHSSFKSLGVVQGGPAAVARALVQAVSPNGAAFVPTFNYGELPFDVNETQSMTG